MKVFAIGDLHLAGGTGKTMERFGEQWRDHDRKIFDNWQQHVHDEDLVVIAGDTSWAMKIEDALPDLARIGQMKGRKLLIRAITITGGSHNRRWRVCSTHRLRFSMEVQLLCIALLSPELEGGFALTIHNLN